MKTLEQLTNEWHALLASRTDASMEYTDAKLKIIESNAMIVLIKTYLPTIIDVINNFAGKKRVGGKTMAKIRENILSATCGNCDARFYDKTGIACIELMPKVKIIMPPIIFIYPSDEMPVKFYDDEQRLQKIDMQAFAYITKPSSRYVHDTDVFLTTKQKELDNINNEIAALNKRIADYNDTLPLTFKPARIDKVNRLIT